MKHLLTALLILLAGPFLTCDPNDNTLYYKLFIDGTQVGDIFNAQPDGSARIDLGSLTISDGNHSYILQAGNIWGFSSNSAPLLDTKSTPGTPTGLGLSL